MQIVMHLKTSIYFVKMYTKNFFLVDYFIYILKINKINSILNKNGVKTLAIFKSVYYVHSNTQSILSNNQMLKKPLF